MATLYLLIQEVLTYKKHRMREPGSDGNLSVMFFKKLSDNMLNDPPD